MTILAGTPHQTVALADAAFNAGDLDGMLSFYEEGATMLFGPNDRVTGKAAIRTVLARLMPLKPFAQHHESHVIESGDIALWTSKWSVVGTGPDGAAVQRSGVGSVILRRGEDGGWRVAIENPWGAAVLDAEG